MSVDCDGIAGIGFELSLENLYKFEAGDWISKWNESGDCKVKESWGDDEFVIDEFIADVENIKYGISGSYYSGKIFYYLFAKDPINGLQEFVEDCNKVGIKISKEDLEFISEVLWS